MDGLPVRGVLGGVVVLLLGATVAMAPACGGDDAPPPAAPADGGDDAPNIEEAPPRPTGDGGGFVVIEVDCPAGTAIELEDNDVAERANEFTELSFCGSISPGEDVDFSKFTTPAGKKLVVFQAAIEGQVEFDLLVNGKTFHPVDVRDFEAGSYVVRAYTKNGLPGKYKYRIQFEP